MKKFIAIPLLFLLLASCISSRFRDLKSDHYLDHRITIVTHPRIVEGMIFVNGWMERGGSAWWGAEGIGVIIANKMAEKGWYDVYVLVEMIDPGAEPRTEWGTGLPAVWRISVFTAPAP